MRKPKKAQHSRFSGTYYHGGLPSFALVVVSEFGNGGGLTSALKAHKQNDIGFVPFHDIRFGGIRSARGEDGGEFVND